MVRLTCGRVLVFAGAFALSALMGGGVSFAQDGRRPRTAFDTGVVSLTANQALRLVVSPGARSSENWQWRYELRGFSASSPIPFGAVMQESPLAQSGPIQMTGDQAAVIDFYLEDWSNFMDNTGFARLLVGASDPAATVNVFVIDKDTKQVVLSLNNKNPDLTDYSYLFKGR